MGRLRFATIWLGGCSGCHMSFLDLDEFLIDLAGSVDVVYSPVVDTKEYPDDVDIALVEGAIANHENLEMARKVRDRTKVVVAFGDCAVTGNVTAMRNPIPDSARSILARSYLENGDRNPVIPCEDGIVPTLLDEVTPIHRAIPVDFFLPGCPPPADRIKEVLRQLLTEGHVKLVGRDIQFG
jgi:NAD-reducing hydrogenase small subunit